MVLDIGAQYDELEKNGEFLFTPPAHVMLAFKEALMEYADEGGLQGRAERLVQVFQIFFFSFSFFGHCLINERGIYCSLLLICLMYITCDDQGQKKSALNALNSFISTLESKIFIIP